MKLADDKNKNNLIDGNIKAGKTTDWHENNMDVDNISKVSIGLYENIRMKQRKPERLNIVGLRAFENEEKSNLPNQLSFKHLTVQ